MTFEKTLKENNKTIDKSYNKFKIEISLSSKLLRKFLFYQMLRTAIRTIAIALIAFPEPFTTVLGILILCLTLVIPRQSSLKRFGNLEELAKRSLQKRGTPAGFRRHFAAGQVVIKHQMKPSPAPEPERMPVKPGTAPAACQYHAWFDNRKVDEKVLHHTLKTSFPQYEARMDAVQKDVWKKSSARPAVEHHKLKLSLYPETGNPAGLPPDNRDMPRQDQPAVRSYGKSCQPLLK